MNKQGAFQFIYSKNNYLRSSLNLFCLFQILHIRKPYTQNVSAKTEHWKMQYTMSYAITTVSSVRMHKASILSLLCIKVRETVNTWTFSLICIYINERKKSWNRFRGNKRKNSCKATHIHFSKYLFIFRILPMLSFCKKISCSRADYCGK